ncbi:peptidoglycan recognition protein [Streptomyces sp. GbtcB6]|uniref:peptidoglycan recognition protein family protein n=1 Tax=Streptomyces sp. GbtcB6 TaxID=2824751 RepID=UPI001C30E00F|nr:peptidoglycan recognition protein [Streptomyces sp. GbtcB6]
MRGYLTCSIGVTCAAALTLPPAVLNVPSAAAAPADRATTTALSGSTQSLPLAPRTRERVLGRAPEQGAYSADVRHFSLVGVVWDNPGTELRGRVQVRTRSAATGDWSGWQDVDTHNADHGADPDTAEAASGRVHGATAPLWVGDSDGVDVRVRADADTDTDAESDTDAGADTHVGDDTEPDSDTHVGDDTHADSDTDAGDDSAPRGSGPVPGAGRDLLPAGLRLELVDPGEEAPPQGPPADSPRSDTAADTAAAVNADLVSFAATEIPALSREDTERELGQLSGADAPLAKPYIGPRPRIVTRRGWGADESLREKGFVYTGKIKAAFVHHTATGNGYRCSEAPSVIRSIYRYHVVSMGWRDIGYNFLVDKCGTIYEGRAGGVAKAVRGAHTLGFNNHSMGIAVIGTYGSHKPSAAAVTAVAKLTAWKLGLFGANPKGKTYLKSGGGNLYPKGKNVRLNVISGHRDGYATECPGAKLYAKLGSARTSSAHLQGR